MERRVFGWVFVSIFNKGYCSRIFCYRTEKRNASLPE
uniref:Uncharacterized protein n=1 Tax=Romanomermis culicivorax TaxID=13658 RepID=A0A915JMN5_ROMCU